MKRIILFSLLTEKNRNELLDKIFPEELGPKVTAYMPSEWEKCKKEYVDEWESYAKERDSDFFLVNNSLKDSKEEQEKLLRANILLLSGGNTFGFLKNIRESGLDKTIKDFSEKDNFVIAGMSAGALVLTPSIQVCNTPGYDDNEVGISDLTGLNLVDFEVFPHFTEEKFGEAVKECKSRTKNEIRKFSDDEYILVDKT